ncbi:hypothetical protein CG478_015525 [Bacillus cytotoxicus]|nr:hypothetical protein CG483_015525 [Bacillus cytotoxicus]AWC41736.1 hypothetical protein CG480_015525 [Bacillus cytotoxicus]AWC45580.1 hypothetical protein CG479_014470 [Bacillus cytotoxicus]AWC49667.1 hypothetical protein CG478_015525 [Bacillus cytotoxicus]AWC53681.1 hypothetical protein CG477_015485 [Bacillus cytotoxicus]
MKTSFNYVRKLALMKTFTISGLIIAQTISHLTKTFALFVYHYTFFSLFCKYVLENFFIGFLLVNKY